MMPPYGIIGVEANPQLGKSYYEKCIAKNSKRAMNNLGIAYCEGKLLERNYEKGIELIEGALPDIALNGHSCEILGNAYLDPNWNGFDLTKGIAYLEKAIGSSYRDSSVRDILYTLGMIYAFEDRSLSRFDRGINFLERAAKEGIGDAAYYLAVLYFNGDGVEKDMYKASRYAADAKTSLTVTKRIQDAAKRLEQIANKMRTY